MALNSSAPPAIITSCTPQRISSTALPIASEPLVHAVPVGTRRPCVRKCTERLQAVVCGMSLMYVPLVMPATSFVFSIE